MQRVGRLLQSAGGDPAAIRPVKNPEQAIRITLTGFVTLLCGLAIGVKLDLVGDLFLLEPLVALVALQCVLSRGLGKYFDATVFLGFVGAGLVTFCGYLLSDLMAANEPWQYLKGWGRVMFLIADCAALMILAAHDRRNLWWLALGIGAGGIASLLVEGLPLTQWKLGYGEYAVMLVLALAPLLPALFAIVLILAFGAICLFADYRSLGAVCLIVGAVMMWPRSGMRTASNNWMRITVVMGLATTVLAALLWITHEDNAERRQQSNIGRYAGLVVAWRAITESPIIGYGSWAANEKFGRMFKAEVEAMDRNDRSPLPTTRSLLPHSQLLQAWIEGGLLGLAFFMLYGWRLVGSLHWMTLKRPRDVLSALFLFSLVNSLWNLIGSPFLGAHRIGIAMAIAVIAVCAHEKWTAEVTRKKSLAN